jgi:hypothetical protein
MKLVARVTLKAAECLKEADAADFGVEFKIITSGFGPWDDVHDIRCDTVEEVILLANFLRSTLSRPPSDKPRSESPPPVDAEDRHPRA